MSDEQKRNPDPDGGDARARLASASAELDQMRALLRDCLGSLSKETIDTIVNDLYADYRSPEDAIDVGERLYAHCALVGVLVTLEAMAYADGAG